MNKTTDVSVVIGTHVPGIGQTLRMALRGAGLRNVQLAINTTQISDTFGSTSPDVLMIYIDSAAQDDPGMQMLHFVRRAATSPDKTIPVVVISQGRDMATIQAVGNAGAHEYALFPASGDQLLKKVLAAHTSTRRFVDTPDYVGPERKPPPAAKPA
ncbi:MAG: hypothetical protein ABMA14_15840 [Hyphomonadaceae bacterium]